VSTESIAAKVPPELKEELKSIARLEKRSVSAIVAMAIENYVKQYNALHPQFRADILEALEGIKKGKIEPYAYG
jgi:predicted transcriptional regulator